MQKWDRMLLSVVIGFDRIMFAVIIGTGLVFPRPASTFQVAVAVTFETGLDIPSGSGCEGAARH